MDFKTECLRAHNDLREKHQAPPLSLNEELSQHSQKLADYLVTKSDFGENTFCKTSTTGPVQVTTGDEPVKTWYGDIEKHNFDLEPTQLVSGRFTQVVWKETREIGVGLAEHQGKTIVVVNYHPSGNMCGEFLENVPKAVLENKIAHEMEEMKQNNFKETDFKDIVLKQKVLEETILKESNLKETNLKETNLKETNLKETNLKETNLTRNLTTTKENSKESNEKEVKESNTKETNMEKTNMKETNMKETNMKETNTKETNTKETHSKETSSKRTSRETNLKNEMNDKDLKARIEDFRKTCLDAHNRYRKIHEVPPVTLNENLSKKSQLLAEYLVRKTDFGENTYCISSTDPNRNVSGEEPVKSWYNESERHNFLEEPSVGSTLRFTQVVWKESNELGVGLAKNGKKTVVVANYFPTGNIIGEFLDNVSPSNSVEPNSGHLHSHKIHEERHQQAPDLHNLSLSPKNTQRGTEGDFEQDFLDAHNEHRKRHGVPSLELHEDLNRYSQYWAENLASKDTLEPRQNCPFGENIYSVSSNSSGFTIPGRKAVDYWCDEVKHCGEQDRSQMENFNQVVSKASQFLGVGVAKSGEGAVYVVATYSSGHNMEQHSTELKNLGRPYVINNNFEGEFSQFALEGLDVHNKYRSVHGVPPLVLSAELCKHAQEWAEHLCQVNIVQFRPPGKFGECIFELRSAQNLVSPAEKAIRTWYNEMRTYDFNNPSWTVPTENFTQLVWKETKELGMAIATNKYGYIYVVANYFPRGNSIMKFEENVMPPLTF